MLQKLGLIKYNRNYLQEQYLNISPIYSPKSIKISNYFSNSNSLKNSINTKGKIYQKKTTSLSRTNYIPEKIKYTKDIDKLLLNNINRFISESTQHIQTKKTPKSSLKINHNIDDNIIHNDNNLISTYDSKLSKSQINKRKPKKSYYINKIKKNFITENDVENIKNNYETNYKNEINNRKEYISKLIINNSSILNKINILKNEYNNNLMNSTEIDKNLINNINNKQNLKQTKRIIDNELLELKESIIKLKNKLSIINNEQSSINLILFKEKIENDLKKEDINKMNKLIDNINNDIKELKKEITLIRNNNKKISMEINSNTTNIFNNNK